MTTKLPLSEQIDYAMTLLRKHAQQIGKISLEWNSLHETLGELFVEIIAPDKRSAVLAAWHAVQSDRSKRSIILAAARRALPEDAHFCDELEWSCGQINALENQRNDAIHAPFSLLIDDGNVKFVPNVLTGSDRAARLKDKDLALEFDSYITNIANLRLYLKILRGLTRAAARDPSWPERPSLPRPAQGTARKR